MLRHGGRHVLSLVDAVDCWQSELLRPRHCHGDVAWLLDGLGCNLALGSMLRSLCCWFLQVVATWWHYLALV
ncbi:hypothetical protein SLA2020_444070 [Shorea laevis]